MASGDKLTIFDMIKNLDGKGSGLDADKIDAIDSTQFIRSDINNVVNGILTFKQSSNYTTFTPIKVFGQDLMYRTFYVDAENGDDNNDGSSLAPFKTIKKAIDSVPLSGYGVIYILNDYEIKASEYITSIHKFIEIRSHTSNENAKLILNIDNGGICIKTYHKNYLYLKIDCETKNTYDDNSRLAISNDSSCFFRTYANYAKSVNSDESIACKIDIADNSRLVYFRNSAGGFEWADVTTTDINSYLCSVGFQAQIYFSPTSKLNGDVMSATNLVDKVTGILKDADSGNPLNVLSNINFSD